MSERKNRPINEAASEPWRVPSSVLQPLPPRALSRSYARSAENTLTKLIDPGHEGSRESESRLRALCNELHAQGFSAEYLARRYNIPQRVTS